MKRLLNYRKTTFLQSASSIDSCPLDDGDEIAFAGRSNAGKSSALNALTQQTNLARISKTPGRTQLINFFSLNDTQRLVDLPGYGYAKVPLKVKNNWAKFINDYLDKRHSLKAIVLIMDSRHPMQEFDIKMINWTQDRHIPLHIVLTKSDKLSKSVAKLTYLKIEKELADFDISLQLFSSTKSLGIDQLSKQLNDFFNEER